MSREDLAHVEEIVDIQPIPKYDKVVLAQVQGWKCIIKLEDNLKVGDKVIYVEIDSILPDTMEYEFFRKYKFRIKTQKMCSVYSQGLILPLSHLKGKKYKVGQDVTEELGIKKYESNPDNISVPKERGLWKGKIKPWIFKNMFGFTKSQGGKWPRIPVTNETRVQKLGGVVEACQGKKMWYSEKVDGSSFSAWYDNGVFGIASHHVVKYTSGKENKFKFVPFLQFLMRKLFGLGFAIIDSDNYFIKVAKKYDLERKLIELGKNIAIQSEVAGFKIQGNKYLIKDYDLFTFNVFDIDKQEYYSFEDFIKFCKDLGIPTVPILDDNFVMNHTVDQLLELSIGKSKLNKDTEREGIVIRPLKEEQTYHLGRVSMKAISPKFLVKYDE